MADPTGTMYHERYKLMIRVQPNTFPSRIPVNVNDLPDYDVADYQYMPVEAFGRAYLEAYGLENFNGGTSVQYQGRRERAGLGDDFSSETESTPRQYQGPALQRHNTLEHGGRISRFHSTADFQRPNTLEHGGRMSRSHSTADFQRPNTLEHGGRMSRSHSTAAFQRPNTLKHGGRMSRSRSTADVQRLNTLEHVGRMSRSNSTTAVQIPASSRYCRSNEHDSGRGRRRSFTGDTSETELSIAIQDSSETANADGRVHDISTNRRVVSDVTETNDEDFVIPSFEPLAKDSEPASRYLQSASQASRNSQLQEFSFHPLVVPHANSQPRPLSDALPKNYMASRLSGKQSKTTMPSSSSPARPAPHLRHAWSMTNSAFVSARSSSVHESSSYSVGSSRNRYHSNRNSRSTSAPNLVESRSVDSSKETS
ncbi:uncharacterized protein [Nicotiana sylvestris]|uniref:Uncharacterized protein LOC104249015 isoform X1 n=1 Tax=Nicotiana sylvestris TaxID=4096 RepID=A0A1U7YNW5_NICSY|nr:PREDICTED: uncharacterized protein LOC104249015 isoform X1 [Nicotiana sylvestris]